MKYELTDETKQYAGRTLHRIRRLSDGELGGWVESEANLSQEGSCWVANDSMVYDGACVSDEAMVSGEAQVYGGARVSDRARVYGKAHVCDEAQVFSRARVFGWARVCGEACVSGGARVYGKAGVYDEAHVSDRACVQFETNKSPLFLSGLNWYVTFGPGVIQIGCEFHPVSDWESFSDDEIASMDEYALEFWRANRSMILHIAREVK